MRISAAPQRSRQASAEQRSITTGYTKSPLSIEVLERWLIDTEEPDWEDIRKDECWCGEMGGAPKWEEGLAFAMSIAPGVCTSEL